jgi:hypothetical protein
MTCTTIINTNNFRFENLDTIPFSPEAEQMFRYVPDHQKKPLFDRIKTLSHQEQALESFESLSFRDSIFDQDNWELYATGYFLQGKLSKHSYAALMLFADYQKTHFFVPRAPVLHGDGSFTTLDSSNVEAFKEDLIKEAKRFFPEDKVRAFYDSLRFEGPDADAIFVIDSRFLTELMKAGQKSGVFFVGKSGTYILTPRTVEKFMKFMEKEEGFHPIKMDLVHGALSPSKDFEDPTVRPIYIPHPLIPNPPSIHDYNSSKDGLGIYLHDVNFHLLTQLCNTPLSHARFWIGVAKQLQSQAPQAYERIIDLSDPIYSIYTVDDTATEKLSLAFYKFRSYLREDSKYYSTWNASQPAHEEEYYFDEDDNSYEIFVNSAFEEVLKSQLPLLSRITYLGDGKFKNS